MNCTECDHLLQQALDGAPVRRDAGLERHLADCPRCHEMHQAARLLEAGLRSCPMPQPTPQFSTRVVDQILADRRRRFLRRYAAVVAVAAAVALVAIPLAGYWGSGPPPKEGDSPRVVEVQPRDVGPAQTEPSLRNKVTEAGSAVVAAADHLASQTREKARVFLEAALPLDVPPMAGLPAGEMDAALDPAAQSLQKTGVGVSAGLQPVANSAQQAVRFFVREMPPLTGNKAIH